MLEFTSLQREILCHMLEQRRFPITRFELRREGVKDLCSVALDAVWLIKPDDTIDQVKRRAQALRDLERAGVICLDYQIHAWVRGDYDLYYRSKLYEKLCHAVMESSRSPQAVFNLPYLRKGYAVFTPSFLRQLPQP